jgi:hypothetical protein
MEDSARYVTALIERYSPSPPRRSALATAQYVGELIHANRETAEKRSAKISGQIKGMMRIADEKHERDKHLKSGPAFARFPFFGSRS